MKTNKTFLFRVLLLLTLPVLVTAQTPDTAPYFDVSSGMLVHYEQFPSALIPSRNVEVWLPPEYDTNKKYRVIYMHDGQMLFDAGKTWNKQEWGTDEVLSSLITMGKIPPVIVVGIWNIPENRHAEYFPQKPFQTLDKSVQDSLVHQVQRNSHTDLFNTYPYSDLYLEFIVTELKPFIDKAYPTLPEREHTFVAGSSMGALISLYALCEYPEIFGSAACLSTHWPGIFQLDNNPIPEAFLKYLKTHLPDPKNHKLYFDHGTVTLDVLYGSLQDQADKIILDKSYTQKNFLSLEFNGHDHSEKSWQQRLNIPLEFLLN